MIESINPSTGQVFAHWASASDPELAAALDRLALGTARLTADRELRRSVLDRAMAALENTRADLAYIVLEEVGKTPAEAEGEIPYALSFLDVARELVTTYRFDTELGNRVISEVPRGIGFLIAPYNDPIAGLTRKIGPCLAAGAAALVKPSELGVHCAQRLGRAFSEAGLDDFIAVLPIAEHERTARLVTAPEIGTVSFTGSTDVGLHLAAQASGAGKGFIGELGGTNPFVLLADADLERAIPDLVTRKIKAAGQACSAQNIVYADAVIMGEVSERLAAALAAVTYGPATTGVQMGPVRTAAATARLAAAAARMEADGATPLHGEVPALAPGSPCVVPPTAYKVLDPGHLAETELFGPLMGLCAFNSLDALRDRLVANRQPLVLYVYGDEQVDTVTTGLRYGSIGINTTAIQGADIPTGGFGQAGIGREGGRWGLAEFLTTINRVG